MVHGEILERRTRGFSDIHDLTGDVREIVGRSGIGEGTVCVSAIGSTASITTIEFEPALVRDMEEALEKRRRLLGEEVPNHKLGTLADRLRLDHQPSHRALDDALAQFTRVETLYPGSDWVPRALQAQALAETIKYLKENPRERETMARAGYERFTDGQLTVDVKAHLMDRDDARMVELSRLAGFLNERVQLRTIETFLFWHF